MLCFITTEDLRSWKLSQHEYHKGTGNNGSHQENNLYSASFIADIHLMFQHRNHKGVCFTFLGVSKYEGCHNPHASFHRAKEGKESAVKCGLNTWAERGDRRKERIGGEEKN